MSLRKMTEKIPMLSVNDLSLINDPSETIWWMMHLCGIRDSGF